MLVDTLPTPARMRQDDRALPRHTHLSDEALVALVARGDESALGELYDRVGRVAYGIAFRILRDDRLAEDAVQEGFLAVWRSAATFRPERAKASTWIVTLVHRRAVDLVRREERRRAEPLEAADRRRPRPRARRRTRHGSASSAIASRQRCGRSSTGNGRRSSWPTTGLLAIRAGRAPRRAAGYRESRMFAGLARLREVLDDTGAEDHGRRESRADRRIRARRARRCGPCARQELLATSEEAREERSLTEVAVAMATAAAGRLRDPSSATASWWRRAPSRRPSSRSSPTGGRAPSPCSLPSPRSPACGAALGLWGVAASRDRDDARGARAAQAASAVLSDPDARTVDLQEGRRLVVGADGAAVLVLDEIEQAPDGKTYEVWLSDGGAPVPAGLFDGGGTRDVVPVEGTVDAGSVVLVTVEDAGGVDAPTSDPIVASQPA